MAPFFISLVYTLAVRGTAWVAPSLQPETCPHRRP